MAEDIQTYNLTDFRWHIGAGAVVCGGLHSRTCKDCRNIRWHHARPGEVAKQGYSESGRSVVIECALHTGVRNLRSFPFRNTKCADFMAA